MLLLVISGFRHEVQQDRHGFIELIHEAAPGALDFLLARMKTKEAFGHDLALLTVTIVLVVAAALIGVHATGIEVVSRRLQRPVNPCQMVGHHEPPARGAPLMQRGIAFSRESMGQCNRCFDHRPAMNAFVIRAHECVSLLMCGGDRLAIGGHRVSG